MQGSMRTDEVHLNRAAQLLGSAQIVAALVAFRAIIGRVDDNDGVQEVVYTIQSLTHGEDSRYLLTERLYECVDDCLAGPEPKPTALTPQRTWVCDSYNKASNIMGLEW